jgi:cell division protein FtsI (penicillin-binding protein 3)
VTSSAMADWRQSKRVQERSKRLLALVVGGAVIWLLLAIRLVQVQGLRHQEYQAQAVNQQNRNIKLTGQRGRLLDCRGRLLAIDLQARTYYADAKFVDQPGEVARHFGALGWERPEVIERQLRNGDRFVYLARRVEEAAVAQAESRTFNGVYKRPEIRRNYPMGYLAGQLLGHTNIDNLGNDGVEWSFERLLRPTEGRASCKVDALGKQLPGSWQEREKPEDGRSVMLTIDANYQVILEQELEQTVQSSGAEGGVGIITDPRTGAILAMANAPLFDPNSSGNTPAKWRRNRAITDPYEPGSTFKLVAASAVLEERLGNPEETIYCENGRLSLGKGRVIRDHHPYGSLTFRQVVEKSSNIGTIKIARRLSPSRYYEYIRNFGFAIRTGVDLPGESAGQLKDVRRWSGHSLETIAFGQEISVTALQLVQAYGVVANGGLLMQPKIVKGVVREDGRLEEEPPQVTRRVLSPATAKTMRDILTGVVEEGTGKLAKIEGVKVAGKTGTAQRAAPDGRGFAPGETVVSFIGFLPADAPELLCLIVIDNPQREKWGGTLSAPTFQRVMERILNLPGERKIALQQQTQEKVDKKSPDQEDETSPVEIPELRGMNRRVARFQAGLRGLPVTFTGEGEVVVDQLPPPGPVPEDLLQITCVLGVPADSTVAAMNDTLIRQVRLLQTLQYGTETQPDNL